MPYPGHSGRRSLPCVLLAMTLTACGGGGATNTGNTPNGQTVTQGGGPIGQPAPPPSSGPVQLIDPYMSCDGDGAAKICTRVDIGGSTAAGHPYPAALCPDVRRLGRPYRDLPVPHSTSPSDPRLQDASFARELAWVTSQIKSTACVCCHDSATDKHAAMWDISADKIWTDQLTPRGVATMSGQLDSSLFGNVPAAKNNGFDRSLTGAPSTDKKRMQAFFLNESTRRGLTAEIIKKMQPLNGKR